MKKSFSLFTGIVACLCAFAGDGEFAVSKIAPALLKNANAVIRMEETTFEIIGPKETVQRDHYVITILNENGDKWADFSEYYDKLRDVSSVEGYLYDADGKQLKKMKYKDLQDVSGVDDNSLIDDNRIKRYNFYYKAYPYTIEFESEIKFKHTLYFPMWVPQPSEKIAVERSQMTIICQPGYQFRSKAFNYTGVPVVTTEKNKKLTTWSAKAMPAIVNEVYEPNWYEMSTVVLFGPTTFQVGDYKGDMTDWGSYGKFQFGLNQGRDVLPDGIKAKVHDLVKGVDDVKTQIRILYEYMQKNTRYISIQLGIGGWQPFDAISVATKGYGDCKALSNYMYSLLKEAGIKSYYTVIRAGANEKYITDDFPSVQFNHIILCAPVGKDSVWLECTSQTLPAGYLSDFTSDRYALLVGETGGKLVRTPKYGLNENLQVRHVKATLDEEGTLRINTDSKYNAEQQDELHGIINYLTKEKMKEYLHGHFDFATYDITSFDYKENKSPLPSVNEQLGIAVSNYATVTGKRLFITPNVMTKSGRRLLDNEERKYDLVLNYEFRDIDSVEIELPAGYEAEAKPQDVTIANKFGKYASSIRLSGNKLYYYRSVEQYSGRYPSKEYEALVKYFDEVYKADHARVVLVKKE